MKTLFYLLIIFTLARIFLKNTLIGKTVMLLYGIVKELTKAMYYTLLFVYRKSQKLSNKMHHEDLAHSAPAKGKVIPLRKYAKQR